MDFGNAIRSLRKCYKITRVELSRRTHISIQALYNIEKSLSFPSESTIKALSNAFGVPVSFLLLYSITDDDVPQEFLIGFHSLIIPLKALLLGAYKEEKK